MLPIKTKLVTEELQITLRTRMIQRKLKITTTSWLITSLKFKEKQSKRKQKISKRNLEGNKLSRKRKIKSEITTILL